MTHAGERRPTRIEIVVGLIDLFFVLAVTGAGFAAAISAWRPAAFIMLGALAARLSGHVVQGVVGYRRVMKRAWPPVRPLDDDEWW